MVDRVLIGRISRMVEEQRLTDQETLLYELRDSFPEYKRKCVF